jgi:hypothetical protein
MLIHRQAVRAEQIALIMTITEQICFSACIFIRCAASKAFEGGFSVTQEYDRICYGALQCKVFLLDSDQKYDQTTVIQ